MTKVCHVTSVHNSDDIRIFIKECSTISVAGYDTYLIAPGDNRKENGVTVIGCGKAPQSRMERVRVFDKRIYESAVKVDADIYHFHDPEMLKYALIFKKNGKTVFFDSHEDVPAQIKNKIWIHASLRTIVSFLYKRYETKHVKSLDAVVAATDYIGKQFEGRTKVIVIVRNYPIMNEIKYSETPFVDRKKIACYAGGFQKIVEKKL